MTKTLWLVLFLLLLSGCQSLGHRQYMVPNNETNELIQKLSLIGEKYSLDNQLQNSIVDNSIFYMRAGEDCDFVEIGSRKYSSSIIIDLIAYRCAITTDSKFQDIDDDLKLTLIKIYGEDTVRELKGEERVKLR